MSQSNGVSATNNNSSNNFHVLILGAGLGGLTLAQCLRKFQQEDVNGRRITFEIFERDESLHARTQGWAIALHGMIDDLLRNIPSDMPDFEVVNHLGPLSNDLTAQLCFYPPSISSRSPPAISQSEKDKHQARGGKRLFVENTPESPVVRANRTRLREWLSHQITDKIHWGKKLTSIVQEHDTVILNFQDGTCYKGDLLVGADGVRSTVREHILKEVQPDDRPTLRTVPIGTIIGETAVNKSQLSRQLALGRSAYATIGKEVVMFVGLQSISPDIMSIRDDDEKTMAAKYYWFVTWNDPTAAEQGDAYWTQTATKQELMKVALEKAEASLNDRFIEIIRATPIKGVLQPGIIYRDMLLENLPGVTARRVTLLGDAAHPMTPFRGEGGCHAFRDSLNFAQAVKKMVAQPSEIPSYMEEYEQELLTRGSNAVNKSRGAWNSGQHAWGQDLKEEECEI